MSARHPAAHIHDRLHRTHPHAPRQKESYTEFHMAEYEAKQAPMGVLMAGYKRHRGHSAVEVQHPREAYEFEPSASMSAVEHQREIVRQIGADLQRRENSEREQQHHRQAGGSTNTNPRHKSGQVLIDPQWLWDQGVYTNETTHLPGITQVPDSHAPRDRAHV